jgi:hypothetical protein
MAFADRELIDPVVHCFARCHWCRAFIPITKDENGLVLDERNCPKCGAEISQERLISSFAQNFIHTQAITSANKFISLDLAAVPFLACSILLVFMNFPLWFRIPFMLVYHAPIVLAINWLRKYWYYFRFTDEEYMTSVRQMKRFLLIWIAANLINWLLIAGQLYLSS